TQQRRNRPDTHLYRKCRSDDDEAVCRKIGSIVRVYARRMSGFCSKKVALSSCRLDLNGDACTGAAAPDDEDAAAAGLLDAAAMAGEDAAASAAAAAAAAERA